MSQYKHIIAIVILIDVVFLILMYYCPPRHQDALTSLFFSFRVAGFCIVVSIVLFMLKKRRWGKTFLANAFLMLFAVNAASGLSSRTHWKSGHIDYAFQANDSSFSITIDKHDSLFFIYFEDKYHTEGYCQGVYRKEASNIYYMDVDTNSWKTHLRRLVIKNGTIEGFGEKKIPLKSR